MRSRRIVIAGAGIGGLTAALALAGRGHSVVIFEKTAALQAVGAGVQLSPNASRVLIALGLRDALRRRATAPDAILLGSVRAGRVLARLPVEQRADAPYWVIHRADLQAALLAAVEASPAIELRLGTGITTFSQGTDTVTVSSDDEVLSADALVAADGVASSIRRALFQDAAAVPSGWTAWRGMTERAGTAEVRVWMGPQAHLVAYPVAGGTRTNLVLTLRSELQAGDINTELERHRWPDAARALIAEAGALAPYPLATAPALSAWSHGRVALLGDAAHAILPFAAQGAAMAIEDAAVLARCLDDVDTPRALARYTALRRPRVAKVADAARQSGRIYHMGLPIALARDIAIGLLGSGRLMRRQAWIYDWTP